MTELLCSWLNEDIKLDQSITKETLESEFANGYLIGEILSKHGLQEDFSSFAKGKSSESKLSNFMKLEPTLRLLQIPFDTNTIHDIIVCKRGVGTKLLYQLYIALKKKKQNHWTGQTMEVMRPQAKARLENTQTDFFQQRLKQQVPRQVDLTFKQLIEKFEEQKKKRDQILAKQQQHEEDIVMERRKVICKESMQKRRDVKAAQAEMYKRLEPLNLPQKDTRGSSGSGFREKSEARQKKKALEDTMRQIAEFEENHSITPKPMSPTYERDISPTDNKFKITDDSSYYKEIKERAKEEAFARRDRDARRRKLLVDQMKLIHQTEEQQRERAQADRLMRQSLQEKRIATQLMQIRKEKDNIRNNRIERQKQYEEERNKMFREALDKEAVMAAREREEQKLLLQAQKEKRKKLMLQRARENYEKHYATAMGMVKEIVMLSVKIGEYRELTQGSIPDKIVRDWKLLFIKGIPLYEGDSLSSSISSQASSLQEQQDSDDLLDTVDFKEYMEVKNEWSITNTGSDDDNDDQLNLPGDSNPVLTHIVHRLIEMVTPPQKLPSPPPFPKFQIKGAFLGLPYTGKTTLLTQLSSRDDFTILTPSALIQKVLQTYHTETAPPPSPQEPQVIEEDNVVEKQNDRINSSNRKKTGKKETSSGQSPSLGRSPLKEQPTDVIMEDSEEPHDQPVEQVIVLSEEGKLGERVYNAVSNGEIIDDQTTVDIIINEIRSLSDGSSWMLDNYPTTLYQAQLLATGLTGQGAIALKEQSNTAKQRAHNFLLIPNREVKEEELQNLRDACGLDLVIHLNATVDTVLARSAQHQKELSDPPDIQECVLAYDDNWPKVKKWFNQFRILTEVDANLDISEVSDKVNKIVMKKYEKFKQMESMKKHGIKLSVSNDSNLSSRSVTKMAKPRASKKEETNVKKSTSSPHMRRRRPSSAGTRHEVAIMTDTDGGPIVVAKDTDKKQKRKSAEETLFEMMDPSVHPGAPSWMYFDNTLNPEMIESLSQRWPMAERAYSRAFLGVFRQLRKERDDICHYLYNRRVEFFKYLKRPDSKQEFVSQWQRSFNQIQPHIRREDIMKGELHHRVEDLVDKLWDICEVRKKEAGQERQNIIDDQWLIDKMGVVSNHYISLMNCELVKFQDAILLLKDYYAAMQEDTPIAILPSVNERLPLIQLPGAPAPGDPPSLVSSQQSLKKSSEEQLTADQENTTATDNQPPPPPEATVPDRHIPLMPREPPVIPDPAAEEKTKRKSANELLTPPREDISGLELDEQLIVHSYNNAIAGIFKIMTSEVQILETASAEANKKPATPVAAPTEAKDKSSGKGKKGAKSPAGKKGKGTPKDKKGDSSVTATPNKVSVSPEEMAKKQRGERMRKEHMFALKHEESIAKARVQLLKIKALEFIAYLKSQCTTLYDKMEEWIGEFYQQEVESVNQLGEVLRSAIEMETRLKYELILPGVDFEIHQNVLMYPPTPPVSPPPPREPTHPIQFTSLQLISLYNQLKLIAPNGIITLQKLITFIHYLVNKSFGENVFPVMWIGLTRDFVSQLCHAIYGKRAEIIQWVRFFQFAAQPYASPSHEDLMKASDDFKSLKEEEKNIEGLKTLDLWFNMDNVRERTYKELLIDGFSMLMDNKSPLDYDKLLFLMCNGSTIESGLLKATTLAVHMDKSTNPGAVSNDGEDGLLVSSNAFYKVLHYGSHDNEFTLDMVKKLYKAINYGGAVEATPIPFTALVQEDSIMELLDTCINYQLPDVGGFLNRPSSTEPPSTPAPHDGHS